MRGPRYNLAGETVLVMGLGRFGGGVDVVRFAAAAGARVIVTDKASPEELSDSLAQLRDLPGIELHLGQHDPEDFTRADVVVANPAVRPDSELLRIARAHGRMVTSQIALFFQACPARIVGITGANGKSTTTALTAHVLERARSRGGACSYDRVWLSGNIGNHPLLASLADIHARDLVVLELSSFQLEQLAEIDAAPQISLLTNLTPNHLDRHGTFQAYCAAKENIFRLQKRDPTSPAVSIFNAEDPIAAEWFDKYRREDGRRCVAFSADDVNESLRERFALPGRANLSNLAGALAVARACGLAEDAVGASLPDFKPLPHRLEPVATIDGVRWYNDSIATTPQSAIVALEAFDAPKIIIAGGYDKNLPFDELGWAIACGAKAAVLIGATASKIAEAIRSASAGAGGVHVEAAPSLEEAVHTSRRLAVPGDVVLLSPACASYDMFENFRQRGNRFVELVRRLERRL